jgi:hypothetical protein
MQPTQKPSDTGTDESVAGYLAKYVTKFAEGITEVTPAVILRGAARYLQLHGWHQGGLYADDPSLTPAACALGAIGMAVFGRRLPNHEDEPICPEWRDYNRACDALDDYLNLTCAKPAAHLSDLDDWEDDEWENESTVGGVGTEINDWNDDDATTAADVITAFNAAADHFERTHAPGGAR